MSKTSTINETVGVIISCQTAIETGQNSYVVLQGGNVGMCQCCEEGFVWMTTDSTNSNRSPRGMTLTLTTTTTDM